MIVPSVIYLSYRLPYVAVVPGPVKDVVQKCLGELGLDFERGGCDLLVGGCGSVGNLKGMPGVYIFVDDVVLYVDETGDIARRIGGEHCTTRIGAFEGVARLLMYLLDEACMQSDEWIKLNVVDREKFIVNSILKPAVNKLHNNGNMPTTQKQRGEVEVGEMPNKRTKADTPITRHVGLKPLKYIYRSR